MENVKLSVEMGYLLLILKNVTMAIYRMVMDVIQTVQSKLIIIVSTAQTKVEVYAVT